MAAPGRHVPGDMPGPPCPPSRSRVETPVAGGRNVDAGGDRSERGRPRSWDPGRARSPPSPPLPASSGSPVRAGICAVDAVTHRRLRSGVCARRGRRHVDRRGSRAYGPVADGCHRSPPPDGRTSPRLPVGRGDRSATRAGYRARYPVGVYADMSRVGSAGPPGGRLHPLGGRPQNVGREGRAAGEQWHREGCRPGREHLPGNSPAPELATRASASALPTMIVRREYHGRLDALRRAGRAATVGTDGKGTAPGSCRRRGWEARSGRGGRARARANDDEKCPGANTPEGRSRRDDPGGRLPEWA